MGITTVLSLLSGVALFLFGMSLMGDGLKKAAGEKLELILYKLTSTPLKGVLLGAVVTAVIQSSSATSVMVVGFVNSGMMKVSQAIGIIMGANIGTSITGWILCLSYIDGSSGIAQLLSTATISAVVSIIGILFKMLGKKSTQKNVGDIMLGFAILMVGMQTMSSAVSPLRENAQFVSMLTMFSNPAMGIIVGIIFTAILQSASASIGILQALSMTGAISFATAFPITLGIGVGAACPVLLSSIGTNKNGKRTALVYLAIDLFGMIVCSIVFYTLNAIVHFTFLDVTMTPVYIALLNTAFRTTTVILIFPLTNALEKLVFSVVKDTEEDIEEQADFDLLEERFIAYPALAIGQCHLAMNGMAKKARKNIIRALGLFDSYSDDKYAKVQEKENLIDKYEDKLGTYMMQLTGQPLTEPQSKQVSVFLHTISDFERLGDHAVNISNSAKEIYEKKMNFSDDARHEIRVLQSAVQEVLDLTVKCFCEDDLGSAMKIEPLRELINRLCAELKTRHINRLRAGKCDLKQGFAFNNMLTDYERIGAHCSNVSIAMLETESAAFDTHDYQKSIRELNNEEYTRYYEYFEAKYNIDSAPSGGKKSKKNKG
jgi:phosphate:Na+ symporter